MDDLDYLEARLEELQDADRGRCDQCVVAYVNGIRCHEHGCPNQAAIVALIRRIERAEEGR